MLLLAAAGAMVPARRRAFWIVVAIVAVACSFGGYTPIYPFLRTLAPPLMYFRFPVKYLIFAVFAVAVLAAEGFAARPERAWKPAAAASVAGLILAIAAVALPDLVSRVAYWLAATTHL